MFSFLKFTLCLSSSSNFISRSTRQWYNIWIETFILVVKSKRFTMNLLKQSIKIIYVSTWLVFYFDTHVNYLKFINEILLKDEYVVNAPLTLKQESSYNSSLLKRFGKTKSLNANLLSIAKDNPPWGIMDFREWNKT